MFSQRKPQILGFYRCLCCSYINPDLPNPIQRLGNIRNGFPPPHGINPFLADGLWLIPSLQTGVTGQLWEHSLHSPFWESIEFHDFCGPSHLGIFWDSPDKYRTFHSPQPPSPVGAVSAFPDLNRPWDVEIPNFSCSVNPWGAKPLC